MIIFLLLQLFLFSLAILFYNRTSQGQSQTVDLHLVGCKWNFRIKYNPDGTIQRYKAKLIAKGFQQIARVHYFETFSPVVKVTTIRIILYFVVHDGWDVKQIDINNAFLNGDLEAHMYMHQSEGFATDCRENKLVCKLIRLCID